MEDDNEKRIREKLLFYFNEQIEIHVKKKNGEWCNGILVKPKGDNVYIFQEKRDGEMYLFISDIEEVSEFTEVKKG